MSIYRAGTLLIPSGPSHDPDRKHLHVVCNDTDDDGNNLIVPVASWTNNLCDDTCILLPHEHDFVRHKSWVVYRNCTIVEALGLERGIVEKKIAPHADMNAAAFLRVRNGVCRSKHTPRKIKRYFECA